MDLLRLSRLEWMRGGLVGIGLLAIPALAWAQAATTTATPPPMKGSPPAVSKRADQLLKEMGAYIGSARQFTFHAEVTFDHVLPSGQKLQFAATEDVALERPDKLYVEWSGDLGARQFWYDGKSLTLYDPATPFYASESAPSGIDDVLGKLIAQLSFSMPLVDFLYQDPYKALSKNLQYGFDLGQNSVNGKNCRTLAFVEKDIDWQIWIDNGPQLTPCKLVITYKTHPAQPQFTAVFSDWDFSPRIANSVFTPELPAGSERVPFANVATK
jgi:hypothetical protein